jgi:hypothetical protein
MLPEIKPYLTALALPPLSPLLLIAVAWWGLKRHRAWAHAAIALGLADADAEAGRVRRSRQCAGSCVVQLLRALLPQ